LSVRQRSTLGLIAFFLLLDALFLRWVFVHFGHWGFWDWDYQQTLLEVSRLTIVEHGQVPLWNPYLGGGVSLAGNTLNHVWSPSFLVILMFGTLAGTKLCIVLYLALAQWGTLLLARSRGLGTLEATFAAVVFSLGGVYAQRLAHGHFEWIAIAWVPFVLYQVERFIEHPSRQRACVGGLFFALLILDGGPYQFAFFGVFLSLYCAIRAGELRRFTPLLALASASLVGVAVAAIKLVPVLELVTRFPRATGDDPFYGAPFTPSTLDLLFQMFLSRTQAHDPSLWMPYVLNVGSYVGIVPLALVLLTLTTAAHHHRAWIAAGALALWISLGAAAPIDLWHLLHTLPGFSMLRVPSRFNVYVLLTIALLAAAGLANLRARIRDPHRARLAAIAILLTTSANLVVVNGQVFKVAFSIPPLELEAKQGFSTHYAYSPFIARYREAALYDVHPNWPSGSFPAVLENRGVRWPFKTIPFPSHALSSEDMAYRGEVWVERGKGRIEALSMTPNRIRIATDGGAALVRVNVNHDPVWRVAGTAPVSLAELDGTLAVNIPKGRREIELIYRPRSFMLGSAVSLVSLSAVALVIARNRFRKSPP